MPYNERLSLLGIDRLELRRIRADLVMCMMCYKIIYYPGGKTQFFLKTDTACCERLTTRNYLYIHLGTQSIWTTLNFFAGSFWEAQNRHDRARV